MTPPDDQRFVPPWFSDGAPSSPASSPAPSPSPYARPQPFPATGSAPETSRVPVPAAAAPGQLLPGPASGPTSGGPTPGGAAAGGAAHPSHTLTFGAVEPADDEDDDLYDRAWDKPRKVNRWTLLLLAGLVACGGYIGGVLVQKNHDEGLTSGVASLASAFRSRASAGGYGSFGSGAAGSGTSGLAGAGAAGGYGSLGSGSFAGSGAAGSGSLGSGGTSTSALPVAIGTVTSISGTTLHLTNLGGTAVTVTVPTTATVTSNGLGGLKAGLTVSVSGTKAADGAITATSVVVTKTGA